MFGLHLNTFSENRDIAENVMSETCWTEMGNAQLITWRTENNQVSTFSGT